eukprot:757212-Hanusia_phi.AAC.1
MRDRCRCASADAAAADNDNDYRNQNIKMMMMTCRDALFSGNHNLNWLVSILRQSPVLISPQAFICKALLVRVKRPVV